ncbi:MAG: hypothetical protein R3Y32_01285 [Bacillota bacterium]
MTTDFEIKLKQQLNDDIDSTNIDVLDAVMKTPFTETKKRFNFWNMPKRAVATICASVLLLCVGVFATDMFSAQDAQTPMPMSMSDMSRTVESEEINISDGLQAVLLQADMTDVIEIAVLTSYEESDLLHLASLGREITFEDFSDLSLAESEVLVLELDKSSIINMKNFFYFMLPSEA